MPRVSGFGASLRLDFLDRGGSTTGRLLPSGQMRGRLDVPGFSLIEATLVDAGNATMFVCARDISLTGLELPDRLEVDSDILRLLEVIRLQGAVRMGVAPDMAAVSRIATAPYAGFVSPAADAGTLSREVERAGEMGVALRVVASSRPHRARRSPLRCAARPPPEPPVRR